MNTDWDGIERRQVVLTDERSKGDGKTVEAPIVAVVVGFVAVVLLQTAALVHHVILEGDHHRQEQVDASFVCYVVKTSQGTPAGVELLTDCGFIPKIKGVAD